MKVQKLKALIYDMVDAITDIRVLEKIYTVIKYLR